MRVVVQRVKSASVTVAGEIIGSIGRGLLVFVGITHTDTMREVEWISHKLLHLRIFDDEQGKMNYSVQDVGGELLVVSQFTLYASAQKGFRPSYVQAAPPQMAEAVYNHMVEHLRLQTNLSIATGQFRAMMDVALINDGPVTITLEKEAEIVQHS
jgi:D-tyrosyl-tRNA(Tyr) deacylase